jgi:tetratricopeptide (TPR) repeat protein
MPPSEALKKARAAAEKAIELDPGYGPAHARLAWVVMYLERDFPVAARLVEQALKLAPSDPVVLGVAGNIAANIGRIEDAIQFIEFVVSRDPVNATVLYNLGLHYLNAGKFDQAISMFNKVRNLSPERTGLNIAVGLALLLKNKPQKALESIVEEPDDVYRNLGLAMAGFTLGDAALGETSLNELIKHHAVDGSYFIAMAYAYRGDNDRAFEWLEAEYARDGGGSLAEINADIVFKPLQTDPRWRPFLNKIGMSPEQLSTIGFSARPPQRH